MLHKEMIPPNAFSILERLMQLDDLFNHFQLNEMIRFHKEKSPSQNLLITIPQAITYFGDAEDSPEPVSLKGQTWSAVKKHIQQKVSEFLV